MSAADAAGLPAAIVAWIRDVTGAADVTIEQRAGGASRLGYAIDATDRAGKVARLWLRLDSGHGPQSGGVYTLRREAAVYRALASTPVRVAPLVAVHPTEECFLMQRLEGQNWFSRIDDPQQQHALAVEFMQQLAELHRLDGTALDLPELGPRRSVGEHVLEELDIWDAQYRSQDPPDPLLSLALCWVRDNLPPDGDWPVVLVQGDTGPGNFMFDERGLVAITDWEMAHWGDLHDDLAWVYVRDLQERFTHLPDRLRDYERFSGRPIDVERLKFFRVLAQTRCAIGTRAGLLGRDSQGEMANHLIYNTMHMRLLAEALAGAMGVEAAGRGVDDATAGGDDTWWFDVVLDDLRDHVVPNVSGSYPTRKAKGLARIVKYLREADRLGPAVRAAERAQLETLLGAAVGGEPAALGAARAELCRRIEDRAIDHRAALAYCLDQWTRVTQVVRPAMGALADRHYAPLPA